MNELALRIAVKIIKLSEGLCLVAYPDPCSPLSEALSRHGMLAKYKSGALKWRDLDDNFKALSGSPFTVGYGETKGVTKDTVWTLQEAESALQARVAGFMAQAIKDCPALSKKAPEQIAAITSLAYNIGSGSRVMVDGVWGEKGFKYSTACRLIMSGEDHLVGEAIKRYNKSGGKIVQGLVNRRQVEADLWASIK